MTSPLTAIPRVLPVSLAEPAARKVARKATGESPFHVPRSNPRRDQPRSWRS
ncbi:hypothetical protein N9M16_04075 [Candidatus Dependentiae bacterium]|nr:hypothetical protein [Candidatus Dependentiae bacterium]